MAETKCATIHAGGLLAAPRVSCVGMGQQYMGRAGRTLGLAKSSHGCVRACCASVQAMIKDSLCQFGC